jgi:hypothetical protein
MRKLGPPHYTIRILLPSQTEHSRLGLVSAFSWVVRASIIHQGEPFVDLVPTTLLKRISAT